MNTITARYQIHGDNIVECERTLDLIMQALEIPQDTILRPSGSPLAPTFTISTPDGSHRFEITFLPGFGRWNIDINEMMRKRGGRLREAADVIVCLLKDGCEEPLLAIEYSGALPAGNQAWQRNGRALSFAYADVPYFYIAELSGYELNEKRERKAARMPNPAVPFSYLLLTEWSNSASIPVFIPSPGASSEAIQSHSPFYGGNDLLELVKRAILGESTEVQRKSLEEKVLSLVHFLAGERKKADSLTPEQWDSAYETILQGGSLPDFLIEEEPLAWTKTAYIDALTDSAKQLMKVAAKHSRGLTSTTLPMCLVASNDREDFANSLLELYPQISDEFIIWCKKPGHLAICWVMGFKPRGDDARPDRGLPPLCRMLVGEETDVLTVVYGPAPTATWPLLEQDPSLLMLRNGLWEAVLSCSDSVLIDSSTLSVPPPITYLSDHWYSAIEPSTREAFKVEPKPIRVGEHDVDTVLHLLFTRLAGRAVFEGLCNPPGGDWSGLSLLTDDRKYEYRWLNLPRVTAEGSKRPDHVFQIFDIASPYLILALESKERHNSVEDEIGTRVAKYVSDLTADIPSAHRHKGTPWSQYEHLADRKAGEIASGAAFAMTKISELKDVAVRAHADLVFGVMFNKDHESCEVWIHCCTPIGRKIAEFVSEFELGNLNLSVRIT
jgi:hypothetical protein